MRRHVTLIALVSVLLLASACGGADDARRDPTATRSPTIPSGESALPLQPDRPVLYAIDPDGGGPQGGWHGHTGLCIWNWGTANATVTEGASQASCEGSGGIWFSTYAWMLHTYNFVPNPAGRFQKWNSNVP